MTVHLCRDFLTLPSAPSPATNMYLIAMFAHHVLRFDVESNVNFDLTNTSFTKGRYDQDPSSLTLCSINLASTGSVVTFPSGAYTFTSADVNRILALRSDLNPTYNSGLFRITSIDPAKFSVGIDYRSSESPLMESGTLAWRIFETETAVAPLWNSGSNNSPTGYCSRGTATASRALLNAPAGWHLRLCLESAPDRSGTLPAGFSITPGAGSVNRADWDDVEGYLHGPMWFNSRSPNYRGMSVGLAPNTNNGEWTNGQWRFTALGDLHTSTMTVFTRNVSFASGGNGWASFGIPFDEDVSVSGKIIDRLYVMGYGQALPNLTWHTGFFNDGHMTGITWSRYGFPMPMIASTYANIINSDPHNRSISTASDSNFINATELMDVELLGGVSPTSASPLTQSVVPFAARRVGQLPFAMLGRSNYTQWALTPDKTWMHTLDGIYVPWAGPHLSGTVTGSSNVVTAFTASHLYGSGLQFFTEDPPMEDPAGPAQDPGTFIDAQRFRKTYSYFRQPTIDIGSVKAGSNPPKP